MSVKILKHIFSEIERVNKNKKEKKHNIYRYETI